VLQPALDTDFDCVIFKSDCQHVVNATLNDRNYENEFETLILSCKFFLSSNDSYNLIFILRQTNRVVHNFIRKIVY